VLAAVVATAAKKKKTVERERQSWNGRSSCAVMEWKEFMGKKVAVKIII
jgi:hypothetical protein